MFCSDCSTFLCFPCALQSRSHSEHFVEMISLARQFQVLQDGEKKMQTSMNNIDLDVCKVSALKNDLLKEIKDALRAIEEESNHVSNLLNRQRKRKHQALEVEEKEVEDRCLVRQLELKLKQRCKGMVL